MRNESRARGIAVAMSLAAALLWATYFVFVLAISPGTRPTAVLVYPFLVGGLAYAAWSVSRGEVGAFLRTWVDPSAYLRTGLLIADQVSVLAATYLTGPVDASLLALIGDIVATPLLAAYLFGLHRSVVRSPWFGAGILLSLTGGALTIVGGRSLGAVPALGWVVVIAVPVSVAFYILLTARASEQAPASAVVGQTMLGAGLVTLVLSPAIPGAVQGLLPTDPAAWGVLVALGLTSFFAAPVLYFASLHRAGLALPPMLMTGIPVFTLLLSGLVLHIGLPIIGVIGIPVAVVGGLLALRAETGAGGEPPVDAPNSTD